MALGGQTTLQILAPLRDQLSEAGYEIIFECAANDCGGFDFRYALDLLPEPGAIKDAIALARRPVNEVMISPIPTVATTTDLRRVAGVLLETGLPGLPVTDEQGLLAGFISRTDILRAVASDPPLDLWS